MKLGDRLADEFAACEVRDARDEAHAIGALVGDRPALLLFVRHFGCIGCAQQVAMLAPRLHELAAIDLDTVVIGCGRVDHIDEFVARHGLEGERLRVVSDPTLEIHRRAGLERSWWAAYGPRSWWEALRAWGRGFRGSGRQGDESQQGGAILVDGDRVIRYLERSRHLGDPVDISDAVDVALGVFAGSSPARTGMI